MKVRNGFVSNSSSSSFILALDKEPDSPEELSALLDLDEPDERFVNFLFDSLHEVGADYMKDGLYLSLSEAAQKKIKLEEPEYSPSKEYYDSVRKYREKVILNFVMMHPKKFFHVRISDSGSYYQIKLFKNIPTIRLD